MKKVSRIGTKLNRGRCVFQNFLRDPETYDKKWHGKQ